MLQLRPAQCFYEWIKAHKNDFSSLGYLGKWRLQGVKRSPNTRVKELKSKGEQRPEAPARNRGPPVCEELAARDSKRK